MKRFISVIALLALTASIAACNTMAGAGQDMQAGGHKLEKSADDSK